MGYVLLIYLTYIRTVDYKELIKSIQFKRIIEQFSTKCFIFLLPLNKKKTIANVPLFIPDSRAVPSLKITS